jgi:hypothetical protein
VRVPDGEPAVGPLDQQQLGAGPPGGGGLRRQLTPSRQVVGGVVAQRVAVGQRRGEPLAQRRRLHHLQPDPADRANPAAGQVPAGHPGVRRARAQDHQVALMPGTGVIAHRVRHDLGDLAAGQPDQAEVPHARAAGLGLPLQLHDLEAAPPGGHGVHGAEHAAAGNDHSCPGSHGL